MSDLISRQAAIDAMEGLPKYFDTTDTLCLDYADVLAVLSEHLPSAQPDLEEYSVWFRIGETLVDVSKMHITAEEGIEKIRSYLMRMKKPERKKGYWIDREHDNCFMCSACGEVWIGIGGYNYCPNCGADM